jgi:methylmalonyl-CoA/ethylmalonyl-CoA epimerase
MANTISESWSVDHIGIAVTDIEQAVSLYKTMAATTVTFREKLDAQGVELVFLSTGGAKIELLSALRPDSPLGKFLQSRGPGLHHVCYRVQDIRYELKRLADLGFRLIDKEPRKGAGNTEIAFIHPSSCLGTLTELCQYSGS